MKNGSREAQKLFLESTVRDFLTCLLYLGLKGGGGSFNFTDAIDTHAEYIVKLLEKMRDEGIRVVDIDSDSENRYADHCREADIASAPLRDCISYYNGEGEAEPGSLAYYGGREWHKIRREAEETLDPYKFEF